MVKIFCICIFTFTFSILQGQTITISGKIIDATTKEGIPFATLQVKGKPIGVAANVEGTFQINLPIQYINDTLMVSSMGYDPYYYILKQNITGLKIELVPKIYPIGEVVIRVKDPVEIIKKAIEKIPENYPQEEHELTGFYRELVKENDTYIKLAEAACVFHLTGYNHPVDYTNAFYRWSDVSKKSAFTWRPGLIIIPSFDNFFNAPEDQVKILACRSSRDFSQFPKEIVLTGGPLMMIAADKVKYHSFEFQHFFDKKWLRNHTFKLGDIVPYQGKTVYTIKMDPLKKNQQHTDLDQIKFSGTLYIDTETYAFASIEYNIDFEKAKLGYSRNVDGFGKKPRVITDTTEMKNYKVRVNYFPYQDKWYLNSVATEWPITYHYSQTGGKYVFKFWKELFINGVNTGTFNEFKPEEVFSNTANNSLYDAPFTFSKEFWDSYNMPPNSPLQDSIRNDLENRESLALQYADKHNNINAKPPIAIKTEYTDTIWGEVRNDPYQWMEDPGAEDVKNYILAENEYTQQQMSSLIYMQNKIYREIISHIPKEETLPAIPDTVGDYIYYEKLLPGRNHENIYRRQLKKDAPEKLILDVNEMAKGYSFFSVNDFSISPDNKYLAYSVDLTGNLSATYYFKNLNTEVLSTTITGTDVLFWSSNSQKVLFVNYNEIGAHDKVFVKNITDTAKAKLILCTRETDYFINAYKSTDEKYFIINYSYDERSNAVYYLDASLNDLEPRLLVPYKKRGIRYYTDHIDGKFYIKTNDGAINFKLCSIENGNVTELVPGREGVILNDYKILPGYIVLHEREGLKHKLRVLSKKDNKEMYTVQFPGEMYNLSIEHGITDNNTLRFYYTSFLDTEKTYDLTLSTGEYNFVKQDAIVGYNSKDYKSKLLYAPSNDGTQIPITFIYNKKFKQNGEHPVVMFCYGAGGASVGSFFQIDHLSLLDRGIAVAYPHVRGGSDLGNQWWEQGRGLNKKHTFEDFISCANYLAENKYTSLGKLVGIGGSAGGLLMGVVANAAPQLFNTLIIQNPMIDVLTVLNKLPFNQYEWGDFKQSKEVFNYIKSYSPYENVLKQSYPNLLFLTSMTDERCYYWESAKMTAKLREASTSGNKILLLTRMDGGHAGSSGFYDFFREQAYIYSFILNNLNEGKGD